MSCFRTASLLVLLQINQDICTALNVRRHIHRVSTRRNPYYFYNSHYRRMASTTTNLDDADTDVNLDTGKATAEISSTQMLPSAVPILCPKCRGEGAISKAPSKKSRLRHQRRIEQQQEEEEEQQQHNHIDHKRVKRLSSTTTKTTTINIVNKDDEVKKRPLSVLPRRWDACKFCDQTGLLMSSSKNGTIPSVTNTNVITHPIRNHPPFVAIVGGGIGGMALAVALRHRRIPFHIFEKDSRFDQRSQGYGLTLQQARRALRALGIVENDEDSDSVGDNDGNNNIRSSGSGKILQHHAVTSTKHVVHTPDGSICGEWGLRKWTGVDYISKNEEIETKNRIKPQSSRAKNKKRRQNLHVPRQTLRYALYEALKEASADNSDDSSDISWGHKLVGIQPVCGDCSNNLCTTDNTNSSKMEPETKQQSSTSLSLPQPKVQLSFQVIDENGNDKGVVTSQADLVVGCDGIFSSVREKFLRVDDEDDHNGKDDSNYDDNDNDNDGVPLLSEPIATKAKGIVKRITPLRYLNCIVILGICSLGDLFKQESTNLTRQQQKQKQIQLSALLDGETVFQTADGTTRIYLMPYSKKNNEYMWQLSFPIPDEEIALGLSRRGPKALKDEALRRCQSWHIPIPEILKATPIELVSGYPVYDRDLLTADILSTSRRREIIPRPSIFHNIEGKEQSTTTDTTSASTSSSFSTFLPITLLGDAAHTMSPFKGQGANQALIDALSLARVLYRVHCREGRSLGDALELYEKEMLDRSSTKVLASSEAAKFLHTEIAIQKGDVTRGAAFSSSSVTKKNKKQNNDTVQ